MMAAGTTEKHGRQQLFTSTEVFSSGEAEGDVGTEGDPLSHTPACLNYYYASARSLKFLLSQAGVQAGLLVGR
jgi:hypothetical protein